MYRMNGIRLVWDGDSGASWNDESNRRNGGRVVGMTGSVIGMDVQDKWDRIGMGWEFWLAPE